ncbi:hypothetical protein ACIRPK_34130 [Kitasatospora sp. NPDC101801]|uniref:hypothetical protein n=1 Tax=Kitasatospora sp. NPDC101801 TaxID=3364103 RepID=UPI0037F3BD19
MSGPQSTPEPVRQPAVASTTSLQESAYHLAQQTQAAVGSSTPALPPATVRTDSR